MVRLRKDDAVSPVVGVMLMLVVTIIIGASVAMFSTGFVGDLNTLDSTSVTQIEYLGIDGCGVQHFTGALKDCTGDCGLVFEVVSGEPIDLRDLAIEFEDGGAGAGKVTISYNDLPSQAYAPDQRKGQGVTPSEKFYGATAARMVPYPVADRISLTDTLIYPGERFLVVCEYISKAGGIGVRVDRNDPSDPATAYKSGAYGLSAAAYATMTLIDESSGKVLLETTFRGGGDFI